MTNNRDSIVFIHIPKASGTYVLNVLFNINNLKAEHKKITEYNIKNKEVAFCVRNPIKWYISFYNFFYKPNHAISNFFQNIVKNYNDINSFINDLLNKKQIFNIYSNKLASYDKFYINSKNNYGILTNYYLYFFDIKDNDEQIIINKLLQIKKNYNCFYTENLKEDLIKFSEKKKVSIFKNFLNKEINKNNYYSNSLNQNIISLIEENERIFFKVFYSH
jgi:hypothetical protein